MSKSIAKSRKKWFEDDYEEFDRVYVSKNKKKTESVEVKRTKNRTFTNMKHISVDELKDLYTVDDDF